MKNVEFSGLVIVGIGSAVSGYCAAKGWSFVSQDVLLYGPAVVQGLFGGMVATNHSSRHLDTHASIKDYKNYYEPRIRVGVMVGAILGGLETAIGYGAAHVDFFHKV